MRYHRTIAVAVGALTLCLSLAHVAEAQTVTRGPYLQMGTPSSIEVRWRTDQASDSVVRYGLAPSSLTSTATSNSQRTNHAVTLSGLQPDTRYYYSVGISSTTLAGDASYTFVTSPTPGTAKPTRIWVLGDSGTANSNARAVRDAYKAYMGTRRPELWLMLGDNAYPDGTDTEYQDAVFDMYPDTLRQAALWSTLGNHDGHTADSATQSGPYYDIFTFPTNGEAGGLASGTEAYYSFDYGNIHFVCLNSYDSDRSTSGPMLTWMKNDLVATDKEWIIAFWHYPPYSKGSHDSDASSSLTKMRENALPILEDYGVDVVLGGHSHAYERSHLLDSHYGKSGTLSSSMILDSGGGREDGNGAYSKSQGLTPHDGAVYIVNGSSGKVSSGSLDHPAMFISLRSLGSMVFDISDNRMDAVFIDSTGAVSDYFTITKGPDTTPPTLITAETLDQTSVSVTFSEPVHAPTAANPSNYTITNGVSVIEASLETDGKTVMLTTSTLAEGPVYTLTVNNIQDGAGNPIAPNSQVQFEFEITVTKTFQDGINGYSGTRDTKLLAGSPTTNYGGDTQLEVDGSPDESTLLYWDLTSIPPESKIDSVAMTLVVTNQTNDTYGMYELTRVWTESGATWEEHVAGQSWEQGGADGSGDRGSTVLGSISSTSQGTVTTLLNAEGVAVVQAWVDNPASNQGLIFQDYANASDGLSFLSSETGTVADRPKLTVTYSLSSTGVDTTPPQAPRNLRVQ